MPAQDLEKRVEALEHELLEIKKSLVAQQSQAPNKDWRTVVGMFADDPDFHEMVQLGAEIRRQS
jgi:hypothetical protein